MAINIQEILHPSDSDAIKFEKINYNFDQIVANGGGPTGQKGGQGAQGTKGNTGFKGQKGEQGIKGETGATTSPWQVININPNSNTETYSILKPKLTTDNLHPTVFLGDQTFNENTPADGDILQRATLTIGKHAVGSTVGSDYLLTLWHGADNGGNNVSITLESENRSDGSVRYKFGNSFNVSSSSTVEYYTAFDKFTVGDDTAFRVPVNSDGIAEEGLIRYNPSTNVFQGGVLIGSTVYWTDFCMAPCGQGGGGYSINIEPDGDVFVNQYGTPYTGGTANSIEFNPTDSYDLDNTGQDWTGPATTTTTQAPTTTTAAPSYTLTFPNGDNTVSVPASGGTYTIEYETGPDADQILTVQPTVGGATWINVTNYNATNPETVTFSIPAQGYGTSQRTGSITLTHPDDTSTTAVISVTQAGVAATTQAPTTQAPATTTQAPLPTFTASNINLQVDNGVEGQTISYTWSNNGTFVTVNPSSYVEGSGTYTAVVEVPSGYSNAGSQVTDSDTATGAEVYKIRFDANTSSATGYMSDQTGTGPNPVTIPYAPGYSVSGFTFSGWNTAADGSGVSHSGGSSPYYQAYISGTSGIYDTLDLYAQWTENTTTQAPTTSTTTDSGAGAGCNQYYVANTSSYNSVSFYCPSCGCNGQSVSVSGVMGTSYQQPQYTFCSSLEQSSLSVYLTGSGNGWVGSGSAVNGACAPGSQYPGAPD